MSASNVFSEYELRRMGIKFPNDSEYQSADCVGSCEEELETRMVTKKCRGMVAKIRVKGSGNGTLNITMHVPKNIYDEMYGMKMDGLIEGVRAYGQNSTHPEFGITQEVFDEDGNVKFKAYPRCIMKSGVKRKIENGTEEVAEMELEVSVMPDDMGNGMYEALDSDLKDETAKSNWMTAFTPDMVKAKSASGALEEGAEVPEV